MRKLIIDGLPYAMLMALLLLCLFMFRSIYKPFYDFTSNYLIGIALIAVLVITCYCRSLTPNRAREEGGLDWYVGRAWLTGLMGLVLGIGLVSTYAYQVDDTFFERRLAWERSAYDNTSMSAEIVEMFMENEYKVEPFHWEEISLAFLGSVAIFPGAVFVCLFFLGSNKRDRDPKPNLSPPLAG